MSDTKTLLAIIEAGGYPDFSSLYRQTGYEVVSARSTRKALPLIKQHRPDVIVAEFVYSHAFTSRICNFESLFAALQRDLPQAKVIALVDEQDTMELDKLRDRFPVFEILVFPVAHQDLEAALQRAARQASG